MVLEGAAAEVTDDSLLRRLCDAYKAKYEWALEGYPVLRCSPAVIENADDFAGSATRWLFDED